MSSLTTLFGSAQLALQDAVRSGLDAAGSTPRIPNFIVVMLNREQFQAEFGWDVRENLGRIRRDLERALMEFMAAHGWGIGGSGTISLNVVLGDMAMPCSVEARIARSFFGVVINDDRGHREVAVGSNPTIVGRAHDGHPRGFVPVYDGRRLMSREHLHLTFTDLHLSVRNTGRNLTTLNGLPLGTEEVELHNGDRITCGSVSFTVSGLPSLN
ncbi:MAG: FHA domain-containing protein [Bacteroidetes bacterium]|nr:FHA domain-containing protein [Bacteroidota bacterium]